MPKVSESHLEARRLGILKAALRCFARGGLHGTTMRDICRAANLSPGAVYRYFAGKEELIAALAELGNERRRSFAGSIDDAGPAPEALARKVGALLAALERSEGLEAVRLDIALWGESLRLPSLAASVRDDRERFLANLTAVARRGLERGEIDPAHDPEAVARIALALFEGLAVQKALDPDLELAPAIDTLKSLLQKSLAPKRE